MNKVILIGRLVEDVKIQETSGSQIKFARFSIAVKRNYSTKDAINTDFINVIAWRSQAEFIEKYLRSGALVSIEGRITASTYNNSEGKKVVSYVVTADRVQGLESKAYLQARELSKTQEIDMLDNKVDLFENNQQLTDNTTVDFEEKETPTITNSINDEVPWDIDL